MEMIMEGRRGGSTIRRLFGYYLGFVFGVCCMFGFLFLFYVWFLVIVCLVWFFLELFDCQCGIAALLSSLRRLLCPCLLCDMM